MAFGFKKTVLSIDEYSDVYADIILEYYRRIVSDDKIFLPLKITKQRQAAFSIELSILLLVVALRVYEVENPRKIIFEVVKDRICFSVSRKLFKQTQEDSEDYLEAFNNTYKMFEELTPIKDSKLNIDEQLLGMARVFVSKFVDDKQETKYKDVILQLNEQLNEFAAIIHKLAHNSMLKKTSALKGRYDFVILS